MVKRLRENRKNKKGFTLVELIVVIVIILVLAAVMVPSVLRYVERANQANCKSDAATIFVQLQAEVADHYATTTAATTFTAPTINGVAGSTTFNATPAAGNYTCTIATTATATQEIGDLIAFSYGNANYTVSWQNNTWSDVVRR